MQNSCYSGHILLEGEFSGQILEKYSNIRFHENTFSGSRAVPWEGQTDGQTRSS